MSFQLATVNETSSPARATNFRPLRLGGPSGLVARFVSVAGSAAETHWNIGEDELVERGAGRSGFDLVFFRPSPEAAPDGWVEIYRLESLHGVATRDRTDIVCLFAPLHMREVAKGVWDIAPSRGRALCESLSLSGGTAGGKWLWTESPMTLGATVVGGKESCSGGCSSSPAKDCCGSCH
ncbi:MAG: hypothetical protein WC003_03175 [Terrimicrobiaceae bacterium]